MPITKNFIKTYKGHFYWGEAYALYNNSIYDDAFIEYQVAPDLLPNDRLLLQFKGKCLAMDEYYNKAMTVLEKAKLYRSHPILYIALGDSYKGLMQYEKPEYNYLLAWQTVPNRFYSKHLLVKCHEESGDVIKAKKITKELLAKEVKVSPPAVTEIKTELMRLFEK